MRSHSMTTFPGYQCHGRCESPIRKKKCPVNAGPETGLAHQPRGRSSEGISSTRHLTHLKWALEQSGREARGGGAEGAGSEGAHAPHPTIMSAASGTVEISGAGRAGGDMGLCLQYVLRRHIRVSCPLRECVILQNEKGSVTHIVSRPMLPAGEFPPPRGVGVSDRRSARNCSPVRGDAGANEPPTPAGRANVQHDHARHSRLDSDGR